MKQPLILITCLILNVFIGMIAPVVVNLTPLGDKYVLYTYAAVLSLCDLIYPLGFLASLKYRTFCSLRIKKSSSSIPLRSHMNATSPYSDRVSARSTTVPIALMYTGEFTNIESENVP